MAWLGFLKGGALELWACCDGLRRCYHRHMLRVKLLEDGARLPEVAHPGEDLGYFLYLKRTQFVSE